MGSQDGQVAPLVIGMALVVLAVAGVATDVTHAFLLRRSLQNAADGAALEGAGAIDTGAYYASGGQVAPLLKARAIEGARRYLFRRGLPVDQQVAVEGDRVLVLLRGRTSTMLLRLIGIAHLDVAAEASARPGIGEPPP